MMTAAQVVETSVNVTSNSPSQYYNHPDDRNLPTYEMTPGFKPFTVKRLSFKSRLLSMRVISQRNAAAFVNNNDDNKGSG